jgi:hypothetical protein
MSIKNKINKIKTSQIIKTKPYYELHIYPVKAKPK